MSPIEARRIIDALANAVDPDTGEVLSMESVFNNPQVIRALFIAMHALDGSIATEKRAKKKKLVNSVPPEKAGRPWSTEEDAELLADFDKGTPADSMAEKHGRTRVAIAARLVRLGRVNKRNEVK